MFFSINLNLNVSVKPPSTTQHLSRYREGGPLYRHFVTDDLTKVRFTTLHFYHGSYLPQYACTTIHFYRSPFFYLSMFLQQSIFTTVHLISELTFITLQFYHDHSMFLPQSIFTYHINIIFTTIHFFRSTFIIALFFITVQSWKLK